MLEDFGGHTEVMSDPQSAVLLQTVVVLVSLIQCLMNAGWWATQQMHKLLKQTNLRCPSEPQMCTGEINKEEILPCMFHSPALCRTLGYLEQSVDDLPCQRPNQNWMQAPVQDPFYTLLLWHHGNDIMIICLFFLVGNSWHMCSWVMLTHLCMCRHPWLTPCIPTWTAILNFIPQFLQLWHSSLGIAVCPHTGACNLLKQCKNDKILTKWVQAVVIHQKCWNVIPKWYTKNRTVV